MGRRHLLYLLYTSSVRTPSATPFFHTPSPPPLFLIRKGYSHESMKTNHANKTMNHERAPSTLEVFKRLAEEKANHGVASQRVEKEKYGIMEAVTDDNLESVKESFKEPVDVGKFHRTRDE